MTYCGDFSTIGYTFQFLAGLENKGQSSEQKARTKTKTKTYSFDWALFFFLSNPPSCDRPHEHTKTEAAEARVSKRQRGILSSDLSDGP